MLNTLCFNYKLFLSQKFQLFNVANHAKSLLRHYSVRRCILVVPACNSRKLVTALQMRVDCINFSLFNNVPQDLKDHSREALNKLFNEKAGECETEWCVTVHPVQFQNDFLLDIDAIFKAKYLPSAISIPHISNCQQIEWFFQETMRKMLTRDEKDRKHIKLLFEITSPKGMLRLPEICEKTQNLTASTSTPSSSFQLSALIYGYDALKKYLGTTKTPGGLECLYSRQRLVLTAKAFGLQAIDLPHSNPEAGRELLNECEDGMVLGFTGKKTFHLSHVGTVQSVFSPSRSRLADAKYIAQRYFNTSQDTAFKDSDDVQHELLMDPHELQVAQYIIEAAEAAAKFKTEETKTKF